MKKKFLLCCLFLLTSLTFLTTSKTSKAITGTGTKEDPYLISTAEDLSLVAGDPTAHYQQTNDIDLGGELFSGIALTSSPAFQGTYDGKNYKIENLKISTDSHYIGLFGLCKNAEIKNIKLLNPQIEYTGNKSGPIIGGIAASVADSTITNCSVTGEGYIKNRTIGGGIVGCLTSGTVSNCYVTIPITDNPTTGGIVGSCGGTITIENCYATNNLTTQNVTSSRVGGIVGNFYGKNLTISKCYSTGKLFSYSYAGGIVGTGGSGTLTIENCFSISDIKVKQIGTYTSKAGGILGQGTSAKLVNCYFAGTLDAVKNYGLREAKAATDCYFDVQKNNNVTDYTHGKMTSAMLKQSTYVNWDFSKVWAMKQDCTYPYLRDLPMPEEVAVVPIEIEAESITVNPTSKHMDLYDVLDLSYEILPKNAADTSVTFSTSDKSVAVINKSNQVVAVGNGSAVITLTTSNGKTAECRITVGTGEGGTKVEDISISPAMKVMNVDDTFSLSATIAPADATNKEIRWVSTNPDAFTVDSEGKVKAKAVGFGSVVALSKSGCHLAFCNIIVKGMSKNLALSATASASSYYTFKNSSPVNTYIASKGNDGDTDTYWKLSNENEGEMFYTLTFPKKIFFNTVKIKEHGTEIKGYKIQIWDEGDWVDVKAGTGIGDSYSCNLETNYTNKIRLLITSRVSDERERLPAISEFEVYHEVQ
ncbi:MAG: hypothetical protein HFG34_04460 [Eubacterium sp.]|nr:hypothetical protein [Eubacterium sp.]